MTNKTFDPALHAAHDASIKRLVTERLPHALALLDPVRFDTLILKENDDRYGVDLLGVTGQGEIIHVEVEHKLTPAWNDQYPYSDLRIPFRKMKFARSANPTVFVVVNHDLSQMAVTIASVLLMLKPERIDNKYADSEQFFRVPLEYVKFYPLRGWANGQN